MDEKTLVIGATGTLGSLLVKALLEQNITVRGATRNPNAASRRFDERIGWVRFDYERPETFTPALDGVGRVFMMARPGDEHADLAAVPLVDEMKRQGVRRVVNLTAMGVEKRDDIPLRRVERYLENSGLGFTHLRPNWFMQVFATGPGLLDIRSTSGIHIPVADARISYIDARDIAAVAVAALTDPNHLGKAFTLTGGQALGIQEAAQAISEATGKTIQYVPIAEETARKTYSVAGFPPERVERLIGFYRLVRQGFSAPVSPDAQTILCRPPITFAHFAKDYASCW